MRPDTPAGGPAVTVVDPTGGPSDLAPVTRLAPAEHDQTHDPIPTEEDPLSTRVLTNTRLAVACQELARQQLQLPATATLDLSGLRAALTWSSESTCPPSASWSARPRCA